MEGERWPGLTGNQLKLLAMVCMTLDHVGLMLLPRVTLLRVVGRLAFPIYGWMIGEGCRHSRHRRRYLMRLAALAAVCQVVYFVAMGSLYQCVLVTFSLAVALIYVADWALDRRSVFAWGTLGALALAVAALCIIKLEGTDFSVDYGFFGILVPIGVYFGKNKAERLALLTLCLIGLGVAFGGVQWFGLAAAPLLSTYNGRRGRGKLGWLFYLYYPLHLLAIYGAALLLM